MEVLEVEISDNFKITRIPTNSSQIQRFLKLKNKLKNLDKFQKYFTILKLSHILPLLINKKTLKKFDTQAN